jgi:hypothetical protein
MLKQSKELEAASFSLIASLPPGADIGQLSAKTDSQSFALCPRNGSYLGLSRVLSVLG